MEVFGHRGAANADRSGYLPLALAAGVPEAKDFSNLAHGQSLGWHGSPRHRCRTKPALGCGIPTDRTLTPEPGWPPWIGLSGQLSSESSAALRRNKHPGSRMRPSVSPSPLRWLQAASTTAWGCGCLNHVNDAVPDMCSLRGVSAGRMQILPGWSTEAPEQQGIRTSLSAFLRRPHAETTSRRGRVFKTPATPKPY